MGRGERLLSTPEILANRREAEPTYPYDAIVLLCGGVHREAPPGPRHIVWRKLPRAARTAAPTSYVRHVFLNSGEWSLNFESALKVAAAAEAYDQKLAPVIISSGGPMWGAPPLGNLMAEELANDRFGIPREAIIEENEATDSAVQMKNILGIIQEHGFRNVAVIADSVHLDVAVPLLESWSKHKGVPLKIEGLAMEDLLIERNPRYQRVVDKLHNSLYWKWWTFKYAKGVQKLETDPLMTSLSAQLVARIMEFMRTKPPFYHIRLPGTT